LRHHYFHIKPCFVIVLFLCFLNQAKSQKTITPQIDSLEIKLNKWLEQDSFEKYYAEIREYEDYLKKVKAYDRLPETNQYYDLKPRTTNDSLSYRKHLMYHAHKLIKYKNDYSGAIKFYSLAHEHASDKKLLDRWTYYIEKPLGSNYARSNNYDKAIYFYKACIPYLEQQKDFYNLARLHSDLGDAYKWLGDIPKSIEIFQEGIKLAEKARKPEALQALHSSLADHYLNYYQGPNLDEQFYHHYNKSLFYLDKLRVEKHQDRLQELSSIMGAYQLANKNYSAAIESYTAALNAARTYSKSDRSRELAKNYLSLATVYYQADDLKLCNQHFKMGMQKLIADYKHAELPLKNQLRNENTFVDLLHLKSKCYGQLFQKSKNQLHLDSALLAIDLAMVCNEKLDADLFQSESKYISIELNKELVKDGLDFCIEGLNNFSDSKYNVIARNYFDKSKSRILRERNLEKQKLEILSSEDKNRSDTLRSDLIALYKDSERSDSTQQQITKLKSEVSDIFNKYPALDIEFEAIVGQYLEYVSGHNDYFVYTNIGDTPFYVIRNKSQIDEKIDSVLSTIDSNTRNFPKLLLHELAETLLPIDLKKGERLSIIQDGKLFYLPYDILMIEDQYLIERNPINIHFHHKQHMNISALNNNSIYCFKPNYEGDTLKGAVAHKGSLGPLRYSSKEVTAISKIFNGQSKIDSLFDFSTFKNNLTSASIFHYSGHAIADEDNAYLALDSNTRFSVSQIEQLSTNVDLVTLSACETGLGTFKDGDGLRSLGSAFLNAGAKSIVYSLWRVNDQSTSEILTSFYKYLKAGEAKDIALRKAKLDYLAQANPEERHPYYWSGFVSAGDVINLQKKSNTITYLSLIGLLIFLTLIKKYST